MVVLPFVPTRWGKLPKPEYAIVQVKGGHVTPEAVKALETTVRRFEVTAGVLVCFDRYMQTVENQRGRAAFNDDLGEYPVIQGYSVEDLLDHKRLNLPPHRGVAKRIRQGGRTNLQPALLG